MGFLIKLKKSQLKCVSDIFFSQNNVKTTVGLYIHHAHIYCNIDMIHEHMSYKIKGIAHMLYLSYWEI